METAHGAKGHKRTNRLKCLSTGLGPGQIVTSALFLPRAEGMAFGPLSFDDMHLDALKAHINHPEERGITRVSTATLAGKHVGCS